MNRALIQAASLVAVLFTPSILLAQSGTAELNGVSLPYKMEGAGTPLVLIHGWAVHSGYWNPNVEQLARQHLVIRYDRRGFGTASGKPDFSADPADLKALLNQLGVTRAHILGHSQGAKVALTFALRYPDMVDALVLFGSGPLPGQELTTSDCLPPAREWVALGASHGVDSIRAGIRRWSVECFGGPTEVIAALAQDLLAAYSGADLLDPTPPSNLVAPAGVSDLATVTAPTLVIHGDQEMGFVRATADLLANVIPGAQRVIVPGGGHAVNWQEPDRFAAEVLRFLQQIEQSSR